MTDKSPPISSTKRWLSEFRGWLGLLLLVVGFHSVVAKPFYIPSESMMPGLQVGDRLIVSRYPYGWSYASASFHVLPPFPGRLFGRLPARGDVVIINPSGTRRRGEDLIKRVIGLPGDTVQMVRGRLWLNGRPVMARSLGIRLLPIDDNFHCNAHDPDPQRAFANFSSARVSGPGSQLFCRVPIVRETLPNGRAYDTIDFGQTQADNTAPYLVLPGQVFLLGDNRDNSADSRVAAAVGGLGGAIPLENIGGRAEFTTFSLNGSANWNPLSWLGAFRTNRTGLSLRPARSS